MIRIGLLQCSSPLAVMNALARYAAALYLSNFDPRRERGLRSIAAFGFTRANTRRVTVIDRRGRRYAARLSRPWTTAVRRRGALAGIDGGLKSGRVLRTGSG